LKRVLRRLDKGWVGTRALKKVQVCEEKEAKGRTDP
jgi:hypothetical protein